MNDDIFDDAPEAAPEAPTATDTAPEASTASAATPGDGGFFADPLFDEDEPPVAAAPEAEAEDEPPAAEPEPEDAAAIEALAEPEPADAAPIAADDALKTLFAEALPGRLVETADDARAVLASLTEDAALLGRVTALVDADKPLQDYLAARTAGRDARAAAREAFGVLAAVPDPDDDPEAYAEWKADQAVAAAEARFAAERAEQQQSVHERRQAAEDAAFAAFAAQQGEGFDAVAFQQQLALLLVGDPETGRVPRDKYAVLHAAMNHDRLVAEAKEAARKEGFAEGVRSVRAKAAAVKTPPALHGATGQPPAPSGDDDGFSTPPSVWDQLRTITGANA